MPCPCPTRTALHVLEGAVFSSPEPLSLRRSALVCEAVGGGTHKDERPELFQALTATVCSSPWMCAPPQAHLASPRVI